MLTLGQDGARRSALRPAIVLVACFLAPAAAVAADATRISQLESELQQLRIRIDEQNRRIERLENELNVRREGTLIGTVPGRSAGAVPPSEGNRQPWHGPAAWDRLSDGMSESQVTEILGGPTSRESFGRFMTLFYRGTTPAGAAVAGHVNFRDSRLVAVSKPAFAG